MKYDYPSFCIQALLVPIYIVIARSH